jgi:twitching motility protein PilT
MNVYRQRGTIAAALRLIPAKIPTFEELGLPNVVYKLMELQKGLILITGPTGTGKSTTLASMVNYLNEHRLAHIITIEDPIEYTFTHKRSVVNQREVGQDTNSFAEALRRVLREDPDVILIGEMRDLETVQAALTIAETGHLVLSTLHTNDAPSTIARIIDIFPPHQQQQVRTQLSLILEGVISQILIPKSHSGGRVLACEVLVATPAVKNLIRENKIEQIYLAIQTGGKHGMQTLNHSLAELYYRGLITYADAMMNSREPEELKKLLQRVSVGT